MVNPQGPPGNARLNKRAQNYFVPTVNPYNRDRPPTGTDYRDPSTGRLYPIHCEWRDTGGTPSRNDIWKLVDIAANVANWQLITTGTGDVTHFTTDDGLQVDPVAGNVDVFGTTVANATNVKPLYTIGSTPGTISEQIQVGTAITGAPGDKLDAGLSSYSDATFSVDADGYVDLIDGPETACSNYIVFGGDGNFPAGYKADYSTLTAAVAAASSGDTIFLKEGTYTEDTITIDKNLTITAFAQSDGQINNKVILQGISTQKLFEISANISLKITNVKLESNGNNILDLSASLTACSIVNCKIQASAGDIAFVHSSADSTNLSFNRCQVDGTGQFLNHTAISGVTWIWYSWLETLTTGSTITAGSVRVFYSKISTVFTTSGTGSITVMFSEFNTSSTNATPLILGGSESQIIRKCYISSGSATSITATSSIGVFDCMIDSSNATAVIDGAGTITYAGLTFGNIGSTITTSIQVVNNEGPSRTIGSANIGGINELIVDNVDNTNTASNARIQSRVPDGSGGDPFLMVNVSGLQVYTWGIDNTDSDKLKVTNNSNGPSFGDELYILSNLGDAVYPGTGALQVHSGTDGERPGTPVNGMFRYNETGSNVEAYSGGAWIDLTAGTGTVISVSGTANRITSTGGASPVIDIDAAYVGQASITTMGTVTTGTWNATVIDEVYGGTGKSVYVVGDILYASTTTVLSTLGVGANGEVLTLAAGVPTWAAAAGGGLTWNEETGTSATMSVNNGYIANNASLVTLTLPTTAVIGDIVKIIGKGAGSFIIAQNASENIGYLDLVTTTGTGGSIGANEQYNSLELTCITANTNWIVSEASGNFTLI